jgi:hypothetical protein
VAVRLQEDGSAMEKIIPVIYHQQDRTANDSYCGAASAQMVLHSIGAGLFQQPEIFEENIVTADSVSWQSAPDGLCAALKARRPTGSTVQFKMWPLLSIEAMSRKVCWSIFHHDLAPIVLHDGTHWVVVTGFEADAQPESAGDTNYNIVKFFIHNPYPPTPTEINPPPHTTIEDADDGCQGRGVPNEEIYYEDWQTMYPCMSGDWTGKFIVICDPDHPAAGLVDAITDLGDPIDDPIEIARRAGVGLDGARRRLPGPVDAPLELQQGVPILVEREDIYPPRYYYVVPFQDPDGQVTLLVSVSAHEAGGVSGSISGPAVTTLLANTVDRETLIQEFVGKSVEVQGVTVTLQEEDLYEHLVWRPCIESLSPYWPFYRFDAEGPDGELKVYVRIDGEIFPELHVALGM